VTESWRRKSPQTPRWAASSWRLRLHAFLQVVMPFLKVSSTIVIVLLSSTPARRRSSGTPSLVGFGPGLIEALAIFTIEADEIDDGLRRDADGLALHQVEGKAGIARKRPLPQNHCFVCRSPSSLGNPFDLFEHFLLNRCRLQIDQMDFAPFRPRAGDGFGAPGASCRR
jgi:hypothetical protein